MQELYIPFQSKILDFTSGGRGQSQAHDWLLNKYSLVSKPESLLSSWWEQLLQLVKVILMLEIEQHGNSPDGRRYREEAQTHQQLEDKHPPTASMR